MRKMGLFFVSLVVFGFLGCAKVKVGVKIEPRDPAEEYRTHSEVKKAPESQAGRDAGVISTGDSKR